MSGPTPHVPAGVALKDSSETKGTSHSQGCRRSSFLSSSEANMILFYPRATRLNSSWCFMPDAVPRSSYLPVSSRFSHSFCIRVSRAEEVAMGCPLWVWARLVGMAPVALRLAAAQGPGGSGMWQPPLCLVPCGWGGVCWSEGTRPGLVSEMRGAGTPLFRLSRSPREDQLVSPSLSLSRMTREVVYSDGAAHYLRTGSETGNAKGKTVMDQSHIQMNKLDLQ